MKYLKKIIRTTISSLGYNFISKEQLQKVSRLHQIQREYSLLERYPQSASDYFKYKTLSNSQLQQDLFTLLHLNFKRDGFFVEFGATDGLSLSNTYILEKEFNWKGILAEPARLWHKPLEENRKCFIEKRCVWHTSGEILKFREAESISTINGFGEDDAHSNLRKRGEIYDVETISLLDLLKKHNAPKIIDYISIDTEGSEFEILKNFNFKYYKFKVISVEHNYTPIREKIHDLLTKNGYKRVLTHISKFDDWYIQT